MFRVCSLAGEDETSNLIAKIVVKIAIFGVTFFAAFVVIVADNAMIHVI